MSANAARQVFVILALQGLFVAAIAAQNVRLLMLLRFGRINFYEWIVGTYPLNFNYGAGGALLLGALGWFALGGAPRSPRLRLALTCSRALLGLGVFGLGIFVYATHFEPFQLQVRRIEIRSPKISKPLRLLHVSDFQCPGIRDYEREAVAQMIALQPDLIIHTGDLLQTWPVPLHHREMPRMQELFKTLQPPLGKFTVVGDVDRRPMYDELKQGNLGIPLLESESIEIAHGDTRIHLYGLSLAQSRFGKAASRDALKPFLERALAANAFAIVAGHAPDYALDLEGLRLDVALAGHTHGGQIRLPFWGPLFWASSVPRAWASGSHSLPEGGTLNVSAGIGAEHAYGMPSIRFLCPPEMTVIDLLPVEHRP